MKVLIAHESMFGSTAGLASDVAEGVLAAGAEVVLHRVATNPAPDSAGCDLVVLGAPTHALTLSTAATRADAVGRGADADRVATGLREWLPRLVAELTAAGLHPAFAVFDTKATKARHWPGSAARHLSRVVRKDGFEVVDRTTFYVEDVQGPVVPGEYGRAREWGRHVVELAGQRVPT